jgi:hypothetical protein
LVLLLLPAAVTAVCVQEPAGCATAVQLALYAGAAQDHQIQSFRSLLSQPNGLQHARTFAALCMRFPASYVFKIGTAS